MPKIKRKIRKKDADRRRMILNWFKSRQAQEDLQKAQEGEYMTDPYGRPISVMIPEAEVSTLGKEDPDLAAAILRGGALAGREIGGLLPFLGEALDVAELKKIIETGEDFYENPADPKMYAGMTAAGLLLPNIIERPAKAGVKLLKKGFQKLKGSGPKVVKKADVPEQVIRDTDTSDLPPRTLSERQTEGLEALPSEMQSGVQFVRDFYKNPEVRDHFRKLSGIEYGDIAKDTRRRDAYFDAKRATRGNLEGTTRPDGTFELTSNDPIVSDILEKRANLFKKANSKLDNMSPVELLKPLFE